MALARARVAIGCVVRNRGWILPEYLSALDRIEYDNKRYIFLENDSTDDTKEQLGTFANKQEETTILFHNTGAAHWDRGEYGIAEYANLANVRNAFIEAVLRTDANFLLSIDSDIIVPPNIVTRLLEASGGNAIVAGAISNIPDKPLDGQTPGNFLIEQNGMIVHPPHYPLAGIMDVAVTGAVYLIPRTVLDAGVRYGSNVQGEDFPFCRQARELGFPIKVDLGLVCDHRMTRG